MAGVTANLQDFLLNQPADINLGYFTFSIVVAIVLAFILARLYVKYGTAISNRQKFSGNFLLLIPTTTLIITIVKSSLALSLGLVGALSIVRFRAAIKEPEELVFLFLAIGIGLGLGANQLGVTLIAFVLLGVLIWGKSVFYQKEGGQNLYLSLSGKENKELNLKRVVGILKKHCSSVALKRYDKSEGGVFEAYFLVDFDSFENLENVKDELNKISKSLKVTFLDKKGIS